MQGGETPFSRDFSRWRHASTRKAQQFRRFADALTAHFRAKIKSHNLFTR